MQYALRDVAELVNGQLHGDGDLEVSGAATLRDAKPGDLTLAEHPRLARVLEHCRASAVLTPPDFQPPGIAYVTVPNVHAAFARVVEMFRPQPQPRLHGVSPHAHLSRTARIGRDVTVYPGAYVGDDVVLGEGTTVFGGVQILGGCRIGRETTLFPNVVLYENTLVGDRVVIHAGAVLGAYGFGYETRDGRHQLSAQLGYVEIGNDVEIGAGATIDRGTYGPTVIGEGTKIDNLVMIAHNCRIGRHNLICSQTGVAGSCTTGDYVVMGGQVGVGDHLEIGSGVRLGAKAGVMNDVTEAGEYIGLPATPLREQWTKQAAFAKLPEMRRQLKHLERRMEEIQRLIFPPAEG